MAFSAFVFSSFISLLTLILTFKITHSLSFPSPFPCNKKTQRFYNVFESIVNYYKDLSRYLSELEDGVFIQLSIEVCFEIHKQKEITDEDQTPLFSSQTDAP